MSRPKIPLDGPGPWVVDAECGRRGVDMAVDDGFLADRELVAALKLVCDACPVRDECRAWALGSPDPAAGHVAGGLRPSERAHVRRGGTL